MLVIIDNYDSFTYNLVQYFMELGQQVKVVPNDQTSLAEIESIASGLVISPGPSSPAQAGISVEAVKYFTGKLPILGICLGHQCIGEAFDYKVVKASKVVHGKRSPIRHNNSPLFAGTPENQIVARYHSLIIQQPVVSPLVVSAVSSDNGEEEIMAIEHIHLPIFGIQFHPESIATEFGKKILNNFLTITGLTPATRAA